MAAKTLDHTEYLSLVFGGIFQLYYAGFIPEDALPHIRHILWRDALE